jgi:hypothetical protein
MDLAASMRALRRQWILTCFLLLLTFAAGVAAWVKLPGPYQAESMVALVPSHQESLANGNNPYLSYNGSEAIAGDIVTRQVMAPNIVQALAGQGYTGSYTIVDDPNTVGPILDITVTGKNPSVVENTLRGVTNKVQAQLSALQQSLAPANQVGSLVASFNPTAKLLVSKKARVVVLAVAAGLVLMFAIPQIVDAEVSRRRGRRFPEQMPSDGRRSGDDGQQDAPPYQAPHRRRYQPSAAPEEMPESAPAARPYAERPRGLKGPAEEQVPESVPAVRPYAERPTPGAPADGTADGTPARQPGADRPHRREFTY